MNGGNRSSVAARGTALRSAATVACLSLVLWGCGQREKGTSPGSAAPQAGPGPASGVASGPAAVRSDVAFSLRIAPVSPSTVEPPALYLNDAPVEKTPGVRNIVWTVNGQVAARNVPRLDPSAFRKGDRLRASLAVGEGAQERTVESPIAVVANSPPTLGEVRIEPANPTTGSTVRAVVQAADPDADPVQLKYRWFVDDLEAPTAGEDFTLSGIRKGSWIHFQVNTSDSTGDGPWKMSPRHLVVNGLPRVKNPLNTAIPPGGEFRHRIEAEDPDGDPITIRLLKAPPGMTLSDSTLAWVVPEEAIGSTVEVIVEISDSDGGKTLQNYSMTIRKD